MTNESSLWSKLSGEQSVVLKFASVGVIATLIHAGIYSACLGLELLSPQFANLAAYFVALCFSYAGQRGWTFSHVETQDNATTKAKFFLSSLLAYVLNAAWVAITTQYLELPGYYALAGILFITPASTYLLLKFWVFVDKSESAS